MKRKLTKGHEAALNQMNWKRGYVVCDKVHGMWMIGNSKKIVACLRNRRHAVWSGKIINCKTRRYVTLDEAVHGE